MVLSFGFKVTVNCFRNTRIQCYIDNIAKVNYTVALSILVTGQHHNSGTEVEFVTIFHMWTDIESELMLSDAHSETLLIV